MSKIEKATYVVAIICLIGLVAICLLSFRGWKDTVLIGYGVISFISIDWMLNGIIKRGIKYFYNKLESKILEEGRKKG